MSSARREPRASRRARTPGPRSPCRARSESSDGRFADRIVTAPLRPRGVPTLALDGRLVFGDDGDGERSAVARASLKVMLRRLAAFTAVAWAALCAPALGHAVISPPVVEP